MPQQIANYVQTTLAAAITSAATTATLTSVAGLPTVGLFRLVIKDAAPATTFEITEVASVNVATGVVTFSAAGRGLEDTTAIAHSAGAVVGNDITAAMLRAALPQGVDPTNGFVQVVANQGSIIAQVDVTGLALTQTFAANRRTEIRTLIPVSSTELNDIVRVLLMEGATQLCQAEIVIAGVTTAVPIINLSIIIVPTAGAHTYKVSITRSAGTGIVTIQATTTPAFLEIDDQGSSV